MSGQSSSSVRELTSEDLEKVFQTIDIPACPGLVAEVMAEAQKDMPDFKKLAKIISADVGMSAVTLKLANSPLFRVGDPVISIPKAVERLGLRNILNVVIATALKASMVGMQNKFIETYWAKTMNMAMAAALIARRQYGLAPDSAYMYALFHDSGVPLMMRRYENYKNALEECQTSGRMLIEVENQYFPCTHPIIGWLLVRGWGLPDTVGQAIRFHHDPDVYDLPDEVLPGASVSLIAVTQIAEHLTCEVFGETDLEVGEQLFQRALAHFGIDKDEVADYRELIELARNSQ